MTLQPQPQTEFDWAIYADATFAGLAVLIPIPIVDWLFETFFRRRMPKTIATRREQLLEPSILKQLNRTTFDGCLKTALVLPISFSVWLIKRISRKILYFLTIKEASDMVSYYWHRAFLLDYALLSGHLRHLDSTVRAHQAINTVLKTITVSPLLQLAQQITAGTSHILRTLLQVRQGDEDDMVQAKKAQMDQSWSRFEAYFKEIAARYDQAYAQAAQGEAPGDPH